MTLEDRIQLSKQQFDVKAKEQQEYLEAYEACGVEMAKLQGEYRILTELRDEQTLNNSDAGTIEVPEEE